MGLTLEKANKIIAAGVEEGRKIGRNFSIVVLDAGGHLVAAQRMDGAAFISPQIAQAKAYGCAAFRRDGPQLAGMSQNAGFISTLVEITGGKFAASLGAMRIMEGDEVVGSVGVSGAAPEQDQQVAEVGVRAIQ